ncbi:hypothetical protein AMELA_G00047620 [Ameiurus melas]|uniref:Uncharacterized protein n=1 Tax=Ameiurus melas TaxID=219545 RepID=A0A7J6B4R0_AMEME|nr:hypothetical protein AMELA_G00047620 [Ameiurus melas]
MSRQRCAVFSHPDTPVQDTSLRCRLEQSAVWRQLCTTLPNYGLLSLTTIHPTEQHLRGTCKRSWKLRKCCGASVMILTSFIFMRQKEMVAQPVSRPKTSPPSCSGSGT